MKIAALIFAASLAACSTPGQVVGTDTLVAAEKSLTLAHLAYDGVGMSLKTAAESGVLRGSNAATARCWYDRAGDALNAADTADIALNASNIMAAISQAQTAIVQAKAPTAACQ